MEHRNRDELFLDDSDRGYLHQPRCTKHPCITSPTRSLHPLPSLARRATGTQPIQHQLPRTQEQHKDKREKPQDLQLSPGASAGKQSSRHEECSGLFARAAVCLRQRGHASACRFKSYCCSGLGASLFPLPFRQAWSQPGIKLFKSSRWASQLSCCMEHAGCGIPRAPAPGPALTLVHTGSSDHKQAGDSSALRCKSIIKP